jgi:hypothetical protein
VGCKEKSLLSKTRKDIDHLNSTLQEIAALSEAAQPEKPFAGFMRPPAEKYYGYYVRILKAGRPEVKGKSAQRLPNAIGAGAASGGENFLY